VQPSQPVARGAGACRWAGGRPGNPPLLGPSTAERSRHILGKATLGCTLLVSEGVAWALFVFFRPSALAMGADACRWFAGRRCARPCLALRPRRRRTTDQ
jgi:hypothetical protein